MSVWLKEWRAAFQLTPLLFLLLLGVWTAAPLQAQSETESGYPAPADEQPIDAEEEWPAEPYPAPSPTPFTLIPLDTPASEEFVDDSGYDFEPAPTSSILLPSVGSSPAGNGQTVSGGAVEPQAGGSVSRALLWLTFSAALLIFIGAAFWSIMLFNRRMTGGR